MNTWLFQQLEVDTPPISNCAIVPLCVVFDIWIANCDRSASNLLLQPDPIGQDLSKARGARVWLIDHGFSLLWPPTKFGQAGDDFSKIEIRNGDTDRDRFIRERMLETPPTERYWNALSGTSPENRQKLYARVKSIPDSTLQSVVRQVPGAYFDQHQMDLTLQLLKARRDRVAQISERML